MNLTAEQIQKNWEKYLKIVNTFITGDRKQQLLSLYNSMADEMITAPASGKSHYHNAFPGGYVDHVNRVVHCAIKTKELWQTLGGVIDFTDEELVFAALNHDLGKVGDEGKQYYIPQTDAWRRDKLSEMYSNNPELPFMLVQDRSLYLLQKNNIVLSQNEYLAIKLHDGLYDDTNKPYYISFSPDSKLKSNIGYILHQADFLASKIEFDAWKSTKVSVNKPQPSKPAKKVLPASPGLLGALNSI